MSGVQTPVLMPVRACAEGVLIVALCCLLPGCADLPSKHERAAFRYLGPCDERVHGSAWCAVMRREWNEPMPVGF